MITQENKRDLFWALLTTIAFTVFSCYKWGWGIGIATFLFMVLMSFKMSGFFVMLILLSVQAHAAELNPKFIHAIHMVETGGRYGAIVGDHGKSLGPVQIHKSYWQDSGVKGSYQQVTNYNYAVKVMTAYLNRYAPEAIKSNNYEVLARTHNGGPQGSKRKSTLDYWRKVCKYL